MDLETIVKFVKAIESGKKAGIRLHGGKANLNMVPGRSDQHLNDRRKDVEEKTKCNIWLNNVAFLVFHKELSS